MRRIVACSALFGLVIAIAPPTGASPERVSPSAFGEVFHARRGALVRVHADPADFRDVSPGRAQPFGTGFLVGAEGEVIFGAARAPAGPLAVEFDGGVRASAALVGFDADLGLGLLKVRIAPLDLPAEPLAADVAPALLRQRWVVTLKHGDRGQAEPFAGLVDLEPAARGRRPTLPLAKVDAPGARGSPVLSTRGGLLGVVVRPGARRCEVAPLEALLPVLHGFRAPAQR